MVNFPYSELEISKPQSDPKKVVSVLEEHHRVPMKNSSRSNFASWFLFTHFVLQMWPCIVGRFGERDHFQGEFLLMSNIAPYWKHWPWEEKLIKPANQQKNASIHEDNGEGEHLADSWRQKPIWASAHHEARHKRVQANWRETKNRLPNCFQIPSPKAKLGVGPCRNCLFFLGQVYKLGEPSDTLLQGVFREGQLNSTSTYSRCFIL